MGVKKHLGMLLILVILLGNIQFMLAADIDNVTEYHMNIRLDSKEHTIEGTQRVVFTNTYGKLDEIVFHLYPNSYKSFETLPSIGRITHLYGEKLPELEKAKKGYISIRRVKIGDRDMMFFENNQTLKIPLDKPLGSRQKIEITIDYILKIPSGSHRFHEQEGSYSLTNWYPLLSIYNEKTKRWDENPYHPIGESNYSDVSNYSVKLIVPKDMVVAPTGTIVDEKQMADDKIVSINAKKVRDFVILMSPEYRIMTKKVDGIKISNYYMKNNNYPIEETAEKVLNEVAKAVKFLNKTIGKYAYDELRIAETFLAGGAMEYPQVIQMGRYEDLTDVLIEERAPFTIEAAVHEAIHQWWYAGVGNDEFNEPFLDESLTVFTTAYYFEKQYGEYHENSVKNTIKQNIYSAGTKPLNSSVDAFDGWGEYSQTIYIRGPVFFEDLRQRIGEEKFIRVLQDYYKEFKLKNANIYGLLDIIGKVAGKEVRQIMENALTEPNYYPENIQSTLQKHNISIERRTYGYNSIQCLF